MTLLRFAAVLITLCVVVIVSAHAGVSVDLETGYAWYGYNTVRIPGTTGTKISLSDDLDADPTLYWRAQCTIPFKDRHAVSLLAAPLRIDSEGAIANDVHFNDVIFPADSPLEVRYRFDSYRIRYRYYPARFDGRFGYGLTGKIRDASITMSGGGQSTEKKNTGFVPLLNCIADVPFNKTISGLIDIDALASTQGRAEDVLLALTYTPQTAIRYTLGYRLLEGGADNDEVYSFALIHYIVVGVTIGF